MTTQLFLFSQINTITSEAQFSTISYLTINSNVASQDFDVVWEELSLILFLLLKVLHLRISNNNTHFN